MQRKVTIIATVFTSVILTVLIAYQVNEDFDAYAIDHNDVFSQLQNNESILLIDIRSSKSYQLGHLYGAAHDELDDTTLEKRVKTIQNRLPEVASTYSFVLVDDTGTESQQKAQIMNDLGIKSFYLKGGINVVDNLVPGSNTVLDAKTLEQKILTNENIFLLDVREPSELLESKIEGVSNIPLAEIFSPYGISTIPTDKEIIVICGSGNRATIASYVLAQEGINFQILEGGMNAWNDMI